MEDVIGIFILITAIARVFQISHLRGTKDMSNKRKNRRGEVYDSWINSFGFGTILFFIFVGFWLAAMAGWI